MREVRIHRLFLQALAHIVTCMKKDLLNYPTSAELYALELAARRERSLQMARLMRAASRALKLRIARLFAASGRKGMRHA